MSKLHHVFARRFRPQTFSAVLGQDPIVTTMKNGIRSGRLAHAYLFSGARGTGKTSLARLFAKAMNCPNLTHDGEPCNSCPSCIDITSGKSLDVLEIDGASHRGIDDIRSLLESISYASTARYKIYIIDEVHMLTKEAFNALLKTVEEPPKHVKLFFATTEIHKVLDTLVSRCQRFFLKRLSVEMITKKLQMIAHTVGSPVDEAALLRVAQYADGSVRDAESMFDQIVAFSDGTIDDRIVQEVLGLCPEGWFSDLDRAIETVSYEKAFAIVDAIFMEGKDIGFFIHDLARHYKGHVRSQKPQLNLSHEEGVHILELIMRAHVALKTAPSSRIILEWLLTSIVQIRLKIPLQKIVEKLLTLEQRLSSTPPEQLPAPLPSESEGQEKGRQESIMNFAAVELDGILIKKNRG